MVVVDGLVVMRGRFLLFTKEVRTSTFFDGVLLCMSNFKSFLNRFELNGGDLDLPNRTYKEGRSRLVRILFVVVTVVIATRIKFEIDINVRSIILYRFY